MLTLREYYLLCICFQAIKDWHLLLFVFVMIAVDLAVLIPSTVSEPARFRPHSVMDAEHPGNFTDVSRSNLTEYLQLLIYSNFTEQWHVLLCGDPL